MDSSEPLFKFDLIADVTCIEGCSSFDSRGAASNG